MASSTAGFGKIAGGVATAGFGGAALAGRHTIGRAATALGESKKETWSKSTLGRMGLWGANKAGKGSFDVRGIGESKYGKMAGADNLLGGIGKTTGKGGMRGAIEEKAKAKTQYAKEVYGKTAVEKETEAEEKEKFDTTDKQHWAAVQAEEQTAKEATKKAAEELETGKKDLDEKKKKAKEVAEERMVGGSSVAEEEATKKAVAEAEEKLRAQQEAHNLALVKQKSVIEEKQYSDETKQLGEDAKKNWQTWQKYKNAGAERQRAYAGRLERGRMGQMLGSIGTGTVVGSMVAGPLRGLAGGAIGTWLGKKMGTLQGNKSAARAVRELAEGKEKKDKKRLLKDLQNELGIKEETEGEEEGSAPIKKEAGSPTK